jgi:type IV secretory pathway VirB4 component
VRGAEAVVVDPEGEFTRLGDVLQGLVLAVGEEPAGLDPVGLATRPGLAAAEGLAVLASVAAALLGGPLSAVDLALLDRALMVLRADRGHRATMSDLLGVLAEVAAHPPFTGSDLAARLSPAASGSLAQLFAANPDLDDPPPLVVFDLRSVPARARPAVMACVLAWTWDRATTGAVATPRLLVVDEAHLLLDDPAAADLLAQFARRARKYHLGVDVVTQRLADFLGNPAGQAVLANTATKLLLGCEDHDRAAVAAGLGLTGAEATLLRAGHRGRGLLLTPSLRAAVRVVAHPAEHELASAGPRSR